MRSKLVLRGDPAEARTVTFSALERPHGDALTLFLVEIVAAGLTASCSIESLNGDEGYDADATQSEGAVERRQLARLSDFLRELGNGEPWDGKRVWKSLTGELTVRASVDHRGHVLLDFEIAPRPWEPTWLARTSLHYDLGDLVGLSKQLHDWFIDQITQS